MAKRVRSARGETVDFDLLKIKQQIAAAPKTTDVKARESFIDAKFKRRLKRATQKAVEKLNEVVVEPTGLPAGETPPQELPKESE